MIGPHTQYVLQQNRQIYRGNIKIAQRHMNVEIGTCGRAIPFLGIFVSNFRYWFFVVWGGNEDIRYSELEFLKRLWGLGTGEEEG
jgi:hypothetical protein